MSEYFSYDEIYNIYAWRDNHLKLVSVQGEGTNATVNELTEDDLLKAPHFQLHDERGILAIPDNGNPRVELAVKKQNGTEDLLDCVISDADNGIIICPIRKSLTNVPGYVEGEIRLISANAVIKFTGINFYIYDGVSDNAAMQSSQFSDLILALQQVSAIITGGSSGTVALDTVIQHGGTKPVASGVIYDFVDGNYMRYKSISGAEADTANDSRAIYIHHTSGFRGIIFFAGYNNYSGTTTVKQFRLCKNGRFEYRTGTVNTPAVTPNTYTWDKTYDEDWNPIGSTQNIQDLAIIAGKIADEAIITQKIKDLAVTTAKIATGAVVESKIANGSVTHDKIGNFAVSDNNIDTGAVTTAKIATKAVTSDKIDDGAITTDKIEDGAVATDKIRDLSVKTAKLANGSVETDKIANSAVTPNKLDRTYKESQSISAAEIDNAVQENVIYHTLVGGEVASVRCVYNGSALRAQYAETVSGKMKYRTQAKAAGEWQAWSDWHLSASTQNIENGAITADKIGANAVTSAKINNGAVLTDKIANYAVTADKLANNSVVTNKIQDRAVTTDKIASYAVTADKLDNSAVVTAKIADGAITKAKLANDSVDTANIIDGAVTSDKIADGAVDTAQLAFAAVTQDNIDSGAVGTDELDNASVTAIKLATNSVISAKIANGAVTADKLAETYVKVEQTIAGIDLGDNITASELAHALAYALVNNEGILNRAPDIYIGKRSAPTSGGGSSAQEYYVNDIYINVLTGELWVCTSATIASVWSYTWDYRGVIYNYPLIITCEIDSENWDNTDYDLTSELRDIADGRNMVDVDFDNTVYNQLVVDGCYGLYVTTNTSTARPTFTLHAMNNAPTNDITIQLTLSQVVMSQ